MSTSTLTNSLNSTELYETARAITEYNNRKKANAYRHHKYDNNFTSSYSELYSDTEDSDYQLVELIKVLRTRINNDDPMLDNVKYPHLLLYSLEELNNLVGMDRLKDSIALQVMRLIDAVNNGEKSNSMLNTILYGPPGVGKTKVGIILAKIWFSLGYLVKPESSNTSINGLVAPNPTGEEINPLVPLLLLFLFYGAAYILSGVKYMYNTVGLLWLLIIAFGTIVFFYYVWNNKSSYEWIININTDKPDYNSVQSLEQINDRDIITVVSRQDFVAEYLGQTATKTKKLLQANLGKVIFIDEAYSLLNDARDSFGMEALTTLNLFMSEHPESIAVVFAGYKDLMQDGIFSAQPGLPRRCMWHFECDVYEGEQLFQIFSRQVAKAGWTLKESDKERIKDLICKYEELFGSYGGDTERVLFYSQLESSKTTMLKSGMTNNIFENTSSGKSNSKSNIESNDESSNKKVLCYKHVKAGIKRLKENNIKN